MPTGSFARITAPLSLWRAWTRCRRDRSRRLDIARYDLDADRHIFRLHRALVAGTWRPGPLVLRRVHDPKPRCIAVAPIEDRVLNQALIGDIGPVYARSFIDHSYGCLEGRGPPRALLAALRFLRQHRWVVQLDVARFFPSVRHDVLADLWHRRLRDDGTCALIDLIIAGGARAYSPPWVRGMLGLEGPWQADRGLAIGSFASHFSGALYLDGIDHFVKRSLRLPGYLRYMDDLLLFHDDGDVLGDARDEVARWLLDHRGLSLKNPAAPVRSTRQTLTFLGHRVGPPGIRPSKKLRRNLRTSVQRAAEKGPEHLERALWSWRGLLVTNVSGC